jgi:hypothetical protein
LLMPSSTTRSYNHVSVYQNFRPRSYVRFPAAPALFSKGLFLKEALSRLLNPLHDTRNVS